MTEAAVQTIEVDASPEECFAVAADLAAYPEWTSEVRRVEIRERDAAGRPRRAELVIDAMVRQVTALLTYSYDPPRLMKWSAEPNRDLAELEGSYEFIAAPGGTRVTYALAVTPAFPVPGFLRKQGEKQIMGTALRSLRKRVESLAGGQRGRP